MEWIKVIDAILDFNKTYYAKWQMKGADIIKGSGKFYTDGKFVWDQKGHIPIPAIGYDRLFILDETGQASPDGLETATFKVIRSKNGRGESNLLLVIDEGIPDVYIGTALLVPMPNLIGLPDPVKATVVIDKNGVPMRTHLNTCVVTAYIH